MPKDATINGFTFLFTGTLTEFTRAVAETLVKENGGTVVSGVTSKLNYLVVGADAGSKLDKRYLVPVHICTWYTLLSRGCTMKILGNLIAGVLIAGALVIVWYVLHSMIGESATWGVVGTIAMLVVLSVVFGSTSKSASHSEGDTGQVGVQQDDTEDSSGLPRQTFYRHDR